MYDLSQSKDKLFAHIIKYLSWAFLTWETGVTNSPTNRFFSSVDVTFFKDTPFFSTQVEPDSRS